MHSGSSSLRDLVAIEFRAKGIAKEKIRVASTRDDLLASQSVGAEGEAPATLGDAYSHRRHPMFGSKELHPEPCYISRSTRADFVSCNVRVKLPFGKAASGHCS